MTFKEWVIQKYDGQDSPRGDLAYDLKRDKTFPNDGDKEKILSYLEFKFRYAFNADGFSLAKRVYADYEKSVTGK